MRKFKKKDILKIIEILAQANDSSVRSNKKRDGQNVVDALGQCQETAIVLGNYLETLGESAESCVKILEDYCEILYQMSMNTGNTAVFIKLSKRITKQLAVLKNQIEDLFCEEKIEIIFLPYKASMWDALESIWKAADEDPGCITRVIPIPYFDRKPDGSLGEMHYEGDLYPDYVPITSWQEYDMEVNRPDIAYVHNPYDDSNYVTCIHPAFFARQLKKFVDMLVYVPYFVAEDDKVPAHFCVTPVTILADKIIVQSESVRKSYLQELKNFEKENNCKGAAGNIEKKVLALGSPKYDRIRSCAADEKELPKEWQDIIYRSDGVRKKVVLYNTSVQNMLTYNEEMIEKIEDSLRVFKTYKEEIALWWRPHPLIPAVLQAIRPKLWENYRRVVKCYRQDGWGIYDDSADVDRAIAISDGYYGDGGSVLEMYKKTGKYILKQKIKVLHKG